MLEPPSLGAALELSLMPLFVLGFKLIGWLGPRDARDTPPRGATGAHTDNPAESAALFVTPPDVRSPGGAPRDAADAYGTFDDGRRHV